MSIRDLIYGKKPDGIEENVIAGLLSASRPLYAGGLAMHKKLYALGIKKQNSLPCRVVCIGNLTLGGSGKTPVTILAAQTIQQAGKRVVILSRGYKRKGNTRTPLIVSKGKGPIVPALEAGDEPYLMAETLPDVPIVVGSNRYAAGMMAMEKFSPEVILLDDGFQHWKLTRDCDIICVDSKKAVHQMRLFPRGPLREPVTALNRAQTVIFTRYENDDSLSEMIKVFRGITGDDIPYLNLRYILDKLTPLNPDNMEKLSPDDMEHKKVLLFCGIAKPDSFFSLAGKRFKRVVKTVSFSDHVQYSEEKIRQLSRAFADYDADILVTTEKDAVKLRARRLPRMPVNFYKLKTSFSLETDASRFLDILLNARKPAPPEK